jgi:hypothetical protein
VKGSFSEGFVFDVSILDSSFSLSFREGGLFSMSRFVKGSFSLPQFVMIRSIAFLVAM